MNKLFKKLETVMAAVAFAEAGEFDTAREMLKEDKPRRTDRPSNYTRPSERPTLRAD